MVLTQLHYIVKHTIQMLIIHLTLLMTWQCHNFDLPLKTIEKNPYIKRYRKELSMQLDASLLRYIRIKCLQHVINST